VASVPREGSTFTVVLPAEYVSSARLSDPGVRAVPEVEHV
jgi:hypothetical protein